MSASLAELARALTGSGLVGDGAVRIADVAHDGRGPGQGRAAPGAGGPPRGGAVGTPWLFCAVPGQRVDGHDHAAEAVAHGAAALIVERALDVDVPQLIVPSVREAMGPAAALVHGRPSERMTVVGVTGTNGKTTVTTLLEGAFAAGGLGTGVIGTLGARVHGSALPGERTTPEGPELQRLLARMVDAGVDAVAMEVSSHGLDQHRVDGTRFAVAVFTNLTRDHLDWHGTMEAYLAAKARLFTPELAAVGVVDLDGPGARALIAAARIPVVTVGADPAADHRLVAVETGPTGGRATIVHGAERTELTTGLLGRFNLGNAATAFVAARMAGVPAAAAAAGIARAEAPPGRLERVRPGTAPPDAPTVLVDYAHTPDAIATVVATVRELVGPGGRVVIVVGAGGDRDREKRGPMGRAAAAADLVVVTDDNPRSEDPEAIAAAVAEGARAAARGVDRPIVRIERDRALAIALAIASAGPQDVVLIAGKGHETGQESAGRSIPFDDREVAARVLAAGVAA